MSNDYPFEYTKDQQCSRSFCSAYAASKDICTSTNDPFDRNKFTYDPFDRNDCGFNIKSGSIICTQECGGFSDQSSGQQIGTVVGVVLAVLAVIVFVAYRRGWWSPTCSKNDTTAKDEKEDVTGDGDLEDSQAAGDAAILVESSKTSGDVKQAKNLQM
jgi:hypothetical protein